MLAPASSAPKVWPYDALTSLHILALVQIARARVQATNGDPTQQEVLHVPEGKARRHP